MAKQKTGKRSLGSRRASAGLPAKAGRRRPPHIRKEKGNYVPAAAGLPRKPSPPEPRSQPHHTAADWEFDAVLARRADFRETWEKIAKIERHEGIGSDPFIYGRMRAHARAGILEL